MKETDREILELMVSYCRKASPKGILILSFNLFGSARRNPSASQAGCFLPYDSPLFSSSLCFHFFFLVSPSLSPHPSRF